MGVSRTNHRHKGIIKTISGGAKYQEKNETRESKLRQKHYCSRSDEQREDEKKRQILQWNQRYDYLKEELARLREQQMQRS